MSLKGVVAMCVDLIKTPNVVFFLFTDDLSECYYVSSEVLFFHGQYFGPSNYILTFSVLSCENIDVSGTQCFPFVVHKLCLLVGLCLTSQ